MVPALLFELGPGSRNLRGSELFLQILADFALSKALLTRISDLETLFSK